LRHIGPAAELASRQHRERPDWDDAHWPPDTGGSTATSSPAANTVSRAAGSPLTQTRLAARTWANASPYRDSAVARTSATVPPSTDSRPVPAASRAPANNSRVTVTGRPRDRMVSAASARTSPGRGAATDHPPPRNPHRTPLALPSRRQATGTNPRPEIFRSGAARPHRSAAHCGPWRRDGPAGPAGSDDFGTSAATVNG
jgi:hypothetical protein